MSDDLRKRPLLLPLHRERREKVRFTGSSIGPDLNWLPIKQSAYLTSLPPPPVLSFPGPLNTPHLLVLHTSLGRAPPHQHIHLSLSVIPLLPSPRHLRPSSHLHSAASTFPLFLKPLSPSPAVQRRISFPFPARPQFLALHFLLVNPSLYLNNSDELLSIFIQTALIIKYRQLVSPCASADRRDGEGKRRGRRRGGRGTERWRVRWFVFKVGNRGEEKKRRGR